MAEIPCSSTSTAFPHEATVQADNVEGFIRELRALETQEHGPSAILSKDRLFARVVESDGEKTKKFDIFAWTYIHFFAGNNAVRIFDCSIKEGLRRKAMRIATEKQQAATPTKQQATATTTTSSMTQQQTIFDFRELYQAAFRNELTRLLLSRSNDNETPLHLACQQGNLEIIQMFLVDLPKEAGAKDTLAQLQVRAKNDEGSTPLHVLVEHCDSKRLKGENQERFRQIAKLLIACDGQDLRRDGGINSSGAMDVFTVAQTLTNRGDEVCAMLAELQKEVRAEKTEAEKREDSEKRESETKC